MNINTIHKETDDEYDNFNFTLNQKNSLICHCGGTFRNAGDYIRHKTSKAHKKWNRKHQR